MCSLFDALCLSFPFLLFPTQLSLVFPFLTFGWYGGRANYSVISLPQYLLSVELLALYDYRTFDSHRKPCMLRVYYYSISNCVLFSRGILNLIF
jgi:hypothetical protein